MPVRRCTPATAERGSAAVEMALVIPILLLMVFGVIDYGRMLDAQIRITEAAREGARAESLSQNANPRVASVTAGMSGAVTSSTIVDCPPLSSRDATVTVTYAFTFITPIVGIATLFGGAMAGTKNMTSTGVIPCRT